MIEIKVRTSACSIKSQCRICLRVFKGEGIDALLYEDNEMKGYVCGECMKGGSENFPSVLRTNAQMFRDLASELEEIAHEGVSFPTDEECERVKKELEKIDQELEAEELRWEKQDVPHEG